MLKLFFRLRYFILGIIVGFVLGASWMVIDVFAQGDMPENENFGFQYNISNYNYPLLRSYNFFDKLDYFIDYIKEYNASQYSAYPNKEDWCVINVNVINYSDVLHRGFFSGSYSSNQMDFLIFPCAKYQTYTQYLANNSNSQKIYSYFTYQYVNGASNGMILTTGYYNYNGSYFKKASFGWQTTQTSDTSTYKRFILSSLEEFKQYVDSGILDSSIKVSSSIVTGSGSIGSLTLPTNNLLTTQSDLIFYTSSGLDVEIWNDLNVSTTNFDLCTNDKVLNTLGGDCFSAGDLQFWIKEDNPSEIEPNENENGALNDINDSLDDMNDFLKDDTPPNSDIGELGNVQGLLPPGPVDTLLNIPFMFLSVVVSSLSGSCVPISGNFVFDTNLTIPCFSEVFYSEVPAYLMLFINLIPATFILISYFKHLYKKIDRATSLQTNADDEWGVL